MNKIELIFLGGVPGAGKTSIGSQISSDNPKVEYISSGELKRPEARKRFGKGLSLLNQKESYEINSWFFNEIVTHLNQGIYLIDAHYTYPLPDSSFVRLTPEECIRHIDLLVLVEADAKRIYQRRINRGRDMDSVNIDFIEKELFKEREEAIRISGEFNKDLVVLKDDGCLENALENFRTHLRNRYDERANQYVRTILPTSL